MGTLFGHGLAGRHVPVHRVEIPSLMGTLFGLKAAQIVDAYKEVEIPSLMGTLFGPTCGWCLQVRVGSKYPR